MGVFTVKTGRSPQEKAFIIYNQEDRANAKMGSIHVRYIDPISDDLQSDEDMITLIHLERNRMIRKADEGFSRYSLLLDDFKNTGNSAFLKNTYGIMTKINEYRHLAMDLTHLLESYHEGRVALVFTGSIPARAAPAPIEGGERQPEEPSNEPVDMNHPAFNAYGFDEDTVPPETPTREIVRRNCVIL